MAMRRMGITPMLLERETVDVAKAPALPGRLPFTLPDFTRVQWTSAKARAVWEPRIQAVSRVWHELERWSVADGARAGALQVVEPSKLAELNAWAAMNGCVALVLQQQGAGGSYSSTTPAMTDRGPWSYRVAITPAEPDCIRAWFEAWASSDDAAIGRLLGFPNCCQSFFGSVWMQDRCVDTTWHQACADNLVGCDVLHLSETLPVATNMLWRWLGVRLVPHLPCSHLCEPTIGIADNFATSATKHGFEQEWRWACEILSWPVQWSARHGIALIETPILTISTRTDATAGTLAVQRLGTAYPEEGATGTRFPYRRAERIIPITSLRKFSDAFASRPAPVVSGAPHAMNGFASLAVQTAAHDVIASLLGDTAESVLDLGCGDGTLARRLAGPGGFAAGIEIDPARAAAASQRLDRVVTGSLLAEPWPEAPTGAYTVVLLMPGRIVEAGGFPPSLMARLAGRRVVLYAYGDWLDKHKNLAALAKAAGLPWKPLRSRRITTPMRVEAAIMEM
jgi:SAM-dependent methyltransferase